MIKDRGAVSESLKGSVELPLAVSFDGTNDFLSRSTDLINNQDSKTFTFSVWVYISSPFGYSSATMRILEGYQALTITQLGGSNTFRIEAENSAGTIILKADVEMVMNTFVQILISVDLANVSNRSIYINDIAYPATWTTYTNAEIDFTRPSHYIGARYLGDNNVHGRLSNLFLDYTYRDLSIEANRRLFITADGKPADGLASLNPILYLPMTDASTAHINEGTGGDFVQNGTLATADRGANQDNCVASEFTLSQYLSKAMVVSSNVATFNYVATALGNDATIMSAGPGNTTLYNQVSVTLTISRIAVRLGNSSNATLFYGYYDIPSSINRKYNFFGIWTLLRQAQGHLKCLLRSPPSTGIDQNVKIYKAPTPGLESATWGIVNCLHSRPIC